MAVVVAPPSYSKEITLHDFVKSIPLWEVPQGSPETITGDGGKSVGHWQISQPMVSDYIRITGHQIALEDCFDKSVAEMVAKAVLTHYSKHIEKSGYKVRLDHWLFIWNGGGGAWRRVHEPKEDVKQYRLERYRKRAYRKLGIYEKKRIISQK